MSEKLHDLLSSRYAGELPQADLAALVDDAMLAGLLDHRSVREYTDQPVVSADLVGAIAAAQSAATSSNLQCCTVIAVRDADDRAHYAELAGGQAHVRDAPLLLLWVVDLSRLHRIGAAARIPTEALDYLEMFIVGAVDVALSAQNAAAYLEQRGYGICYIGGMRNHPERVSERARLPRQAFVLFGMTVGHPASLPAIKPRLPQSLILHEAYYQAENESETIAAYNAVAAAASVAAGRKPREWSIDAANRVAGPQSLSGRDRLREALGAMGFPLR